MSRTAPLVLLLTALATGHAFAAKPPALGDEFGDPGRDPNDTGEAPWQEGQTGLPAYPSDDDLMEFRVDRGENPFRYFLDRKALSLGEDGLVRYTLVIRSRTGAANTSFEAMKCDGREYKVFAYGDGKGKFRPLPTPEWRSIQESLYNGVRRDLWEFYLCDGFLSRTPTKIEEAVRQGGQRRDSDAYR